MPPSLHPSASPWLTPALLADEFHKSVEAMPDELLRQRIAVTEGETIPDIWDDWSEAVRAAPVAAEARL